MKKLYICGDSFACNDPDSSITPWHQLLTNELKNHWIVNNLSLICASNLNIRMQVDKAVEDHADFVIVLFTSSVRGHGRISTQESIDNLLNNFYRVEKDDDKKQLGCWSYHSLDTNCVMPKNKTSILKSFFTEIFDLNLAIYENQCIIESSLHKLKSNQVEFLFDQGGFENPFFGGDKTYFEEFNNYRSQLNLWTLYGSPIVYRPYFHITDQLIHNDIANYYKQVLCPSK